MRGWLWGMAVACVAVAPGWALESRIWDDQPGQGWEQSWYPLGNGRLGCMVDGGTKTLRVQFNVDSLWTGDKNLTYSMADETGEAILYNKFNIEIPEDTETHAVWGFVTIYNNQFEIYPISIDVDPVPPYNPTKRGDVNGDGEVNIADVNAVISVILYGNDIFEGRADVNGDGETNIADVNEVIKIILYGE